MQAHRGQLSGTPSPGDGAMVTGDCEQDTDHQSQEDSRSRPQSSQAGSDTAVAGRWSLGEEQRSERDEISLCTLCLGKYSK